MDERNDKQHERYGRVRKRKTNRTIILILTFSIIMIAIAILGSLLLKGSEEHVILNPADTQPGLTLDDDISSGIEESGKPKSSTDDTEWNLTLVNKWNTIPENYKINLVEVPGGEKVDERIYEPLMEMLEAAKEGNWDQLPMVVSGYRTQESSSNYTMKKLLNISKRDIQMKKLLNRLNNGLLFPDIANTSLVWQ